MCKNGKYRGLTSRDASIRYVQEISVDEFDVPKHAFARQKSIEVRDTVVSHLGRIPEVCVIKRTRRTSGIARPVARLGRPREFQVETTRL